MGAEYAELRQFRAKVLLALKKIQLVYPALRLETNAATIIVHPSPTAIPPKRDSIPLAAEDVHANERTISTFDDAAAAVMLGCGFANATALARSIRDAVRIHAGATNLPLQKVAESMMKQWEEYQKLGSLLRFGEGPNAFHRRPLDRAEYLAV